MTITPTIVSYLHLCHRKLWLHAHHLRMESTSELVAEGKLIGETTYPQRALKWQELDLGIAKIDFFDPKSNTIHEIKKSNKKSFAHNAQVKYYLYLLHKIGIAEPTAIIEYPKLRITKTVDWDTEEDQDLVESWINQADTIIKGTCPDRLQISKCKKCSYFDFCWSGE
ncbi:CRISPR-associated protein Cas4 [Flammeovirga agarivorans]|uniref:Dna2/Cas4 domain-containing protein n=1 Tax=Flammeovirga agarivorans TaxID=2726742 RepID=A0A7X8SPS4_9BACT|nr:CRISPR-associated protein Cas4 [Flammeovirga agarivorans]NLR94042.1 Dna2/Cas4 domain-containing protein [Flammeovirga agarivorans]